MPSRAFTAVVMGVADKTTPAFTPVYTVVSVPTEELLRYYFDEDVELASMRELKAASGLTERSVNVVGLWDRTVDLDAFQDDFRERHRQAYANYIAE